MVFRSKLFLLSETEFRKYEDKLEDYEWCWLRTPFDDPVKIAAKSFARVVIGNRTVISYNIADSKNVHVRPACHVYNIDSLPISGCNRVHMGYLGRMIEWTVLDWYEGLMVSNLSFGTRCVDPSTNQYAASDVNCFLQSVYDYMDNGLTDIKEYIADTLIDGEISLPLW